MEPAEFGGTLIAKLQAACEATLKQAPEELFAAIIAPIVNRKGQELDLDAVDLMLRQLQDVIGRPEEETLATRPVIVEEALKSPPKPRSTHGAKR